MTKEFAQEIINIHLENETLKETNDRLFLWFTSALLANDGSLSKFIFKDNSQKDIILNLGKKGLNIELVIGGNFELVFDNEIVTKDKFLNILQ